MVSKYYMYSVNIGNTETRWGQCLVTWDGCDPLKITMQLRFRIAPLFERVFRGSQPSHVTRHCPQRVSILISVLFKYFHFTCRRFGCSFLVRALYVGIFQLGFCIAQRAYSCTLKKGYTRNVCAFTNYDTLTCLTRVLTFSYYHWCHASTELCLLLLS